MTILTRENLRSGHYRRRMAMPSHVAWSEADIERSLAETLAGRPDGPIWVFAYGSLMWNPLIAVEAQVAASLPGWHRSFCLRSVAGRGSLEQPGRVLSLEPGGATQGVALRLHEDTAREELRLLWTREMSGGAYRPLWAPVALDGGQPVRAIAFVARPGHPFHEEDASAATVARTVTTAAGLFGPNIDYVRELARALARWGLRDAYVEAIVRGLEGLDGAEGAEGAVAGAGPG